jgi:hypothetical protein
VLTASQASSLRALDADDSTKPFAELANRALVFHDPTAAERFVSAVLVVVVKTREAWGEGREGASEPEALLLAHMLFLLRCVALRFPSLASVLPAPPAPTPTAKMPASAAKLPRPTAPTRRRERNRKKKVPKVKR